jgi:hypothetical protein
VSENDSYSNRRAGSNQEASETPKFVPGSNFLASRMQSQKEESTGGDPRFNMLRSSGYVLSISETDLLDLNDVMTPVAPQVIVFDELQHVYNRDHYINTQSPSSPIQASS